MGSPSSELSLDYKPAPSGGIGGFAPPPEQKRSQLEEFLARLEEERLKIEAFKRELPLCLQLLNNAIENYKQQLETQQGRRGSCQIRPVLEEFIPLCKNNSVDKAAAVSGGDFGGGARSAEKASWMVTAQLWNNPASGADSPEPRRLSIPSGGGTGAIDGSPKLALDSCKQRSTNGGGAFLPFSKDKIDNKSDVAVGRRAMLPAPELALGSPEEKEATECNLLVNNSTSSAPEYGSNVDREGRSMIVKRPPESYGNGGVASSTEKKGGCDGQASGSSQTHRKARRCWSPDLHRRFVNALQILGGSQVATPKQIRELMKMDGLTNDEVKSHLQKYRLHTRRPIPAPVAAAAAAAAAPQLVVLGGVWVPPEYATSAAAAAAGPAIYGAAPVPHDFYPAALPPPPLSLPPPLLLPQPPVHHHQQLSSRHLAACSAYKGGPHVSPESDIRSGGGGGERSESIEEGEAERDQDDDDDDEEEKEEEKVVVPIRPA